MRTLADAHASGDVGVFDTVGKALIAAVRQRGDEDDDRRTPSWEDLHDRSFRSHAPIALFVHKERGGKLRPCLASAAFDPFDALPEAPAQVATVGCLGQLKERRSFGRCSEALGRT